VYVEPFETQLKGYDEPIRLWRLEPGIKRGG
jgi:hypothetical protein